MKWNICLGWSTTLLCQSFAVRFWFFTSMVCRRKSRSALTFLSHCYLFEILLFKIYIKFFIFWEVYLSLDCVRGIPYLNFLPCPGFCHLTVIYNVFLVHSFCEIALIPWSHIPLEAELFSCGGLVLGGIEHLWDVTAPYLCTPHTWSGICPD